MVAFGFGPKSAMNWPTGLIAAIESGVDPTLHGQQLATRTAEKDRILREISRLAPCRSSNIIAH